MYRSLCVAGFLAGMAVAAPAKDRPPDKTLPTATGCEWAGAGFVKVEGSSTCVRVGGSVRAEYGASTGGRSGYWRPQ